MEAVTIWDTKDAGNGHRILSFDLVDILKLVEPELPGSEWYVESVEAVGEAGGEFDRLSRNRPISKGSGATRSCGSN